MALTYEKIATTTLSTVTNTISFTSIPSTYTDLRLVFVGKSDPSGSGDYLALRFNSDTGSNYSSTSVRGNGTAASSTRTTGDNILFVGFTTMNTDYPELHTIDIFSYAGSNYKTCLTTSSKDLNGSGWATDMVDLWRSTSAITTITLTTPNVARNFATETTATLYGIKAA
jgi:hypothetical protein